MMMMMKKASEYFQGGQQPPEPSGFSGEVVYDDTDDEEGRNADVSALRLRVDAPNSGAPEELPELQAVEVGSARVGYIHSLETEAGVYVKKIKARGRTIGYRDAVLPPVKVDRQGFIRC